MDPFATLPEETVSEILSRTSPLDASRFSAISKGFKSAAEANYVWGRFLPPDWPEIVSRSASPVVYTTMKELYFSLCHSPISLDAGRLVCIHFPFVKINIFVNDYSVLLDNLT